MGLREDAKVVVCDTLGDASADRVDTFSDSDPKSFIDQCRNLVAMLLGDELADRKFEPLYTKYAH